MKKKRYACIENSIVLGKEMGEERLSGSHGFMCQKLGNVKRLWARHANNTDATAPGRGRDGGYGVLIKRETARRHSSYWRRGSEGTALNSAID